MNTWERLKVGIKVLEFIEKGGSMFKQLYKNYTDITFQTLSGMINYVNSVMMMMMMR